MRMYNRIKKMFQEAADAKLIGDRKTAFIPAGIFGLNGNVLVYHKTSLCEVHRGDYSVVDGYIVSETVADPKNRLDGYVICLKA